MKKALSLLLAIVMLLTLLPVPSSVFAADGDVNIRIHYYSEPSWNWGAPAIQFWGGSGTTASEYQSGPTEIPGWNAQGYVMTPEGDGWYSIVLTGDFTGFQFLDMDAPNDGNTAGKGYDAGMAQFTGSEPTDLYCLYNGDTGYNTVWYLDKACTTPLSGSAAAKEYTYLVHYANPNGWSNVNAYAWNGSETLCGAWPGSAISENADNGGWYDVTFTAAANSVGLIFNNGSAQTGDLTIAAQEDDDTIVEAWVDSAVTYAAPEGWVVDNTHDVTLHCLKPEGWGTNVRAYLWHTGGAIPGYESYNSWPGTVISENADHPGWYDLTVTTDLTAFNFIFNDGANQTADLATGTIAADMELWYVNNEVVSVAPGEWTGDMEYPVHLHFQKPAGWGSTVNLYTWGGVDNGSWPGSAVSPDAGNDGWYTATLTTKSEAGFSFIFNDGSNQTTDLATGALTGETHLWVVDGAVQTTAPGGWMDTEMTVHVPGTFPGPSWDAASNQMTYDSNLGLYVLTFENVPAGNYEFKIAINGSWTENYGAGGVRDGSNIAVTVPETMDVTVYYSHTTHNAVTDVTYRFITAAVTGNGIEETALTDPGLTGIYSGIVHMAAGTYTDVVITCDGVEYAFAEIVVDEDKNVTFYFDPITGIFYCNASDIPLNTDYISYSSRSINDKSIFGAVATGEEVTFTINTGWDVTSAVLVVKGVGSYPMTASGSHNVINNHWNATISIPYKGEYDYYFVLSNGSTVAVYGDDDGYYGEGTVTDLTNVKPYDLVVYEAGYETPDWMKNAVIYQIFPDRFFNGDETNDQAQEWARGAVNYEFIDDWYTLPENPEQEALLTEEEYLSSGAHYGDGEWSNEIYGGDLKGITERIDYLKALGVNVIYLNPVFWSISNHRYDAVSYTEIDPILGTLGDFEELVAVAEANDMHIILDGVFNHVSDDSVYFDRYYKFLPDAAEKYDGKIGAYPYWAYVYDHMAEQGVDQTAAEEAAKAYFSENYGITDYSYTEWFAVSSETMAAVDHIGLRAGKAVYSYEGWWGYDSMPVIYSTNGSEYQTGNWAEEIIEGEDSVNSYWISKGMDGWRLDVANEVSDETWQNFRDSVKALDSDAVIIGEIWDDATKYLMGDMYDSVMNYQFRNAVTSFAMGADSETTAKQLEKLRERYPAEAFYAMMNLVGSHDTTRILSYLDGIGDDRNQKDFDSAFPTYEGTSQLAKDRQYLVAFLQFTYAGAPTIYYGDEIGMVGSDDPDDRRAFEWGLGNQELVEYYARLAAIRNAYSALRTGSVEYIGVNNSNLLAHVRSDSEALLLTIGNNSQTAQTHTLGYDAVELISGKTYAAHEEIPIPALRGVILVQVDEVKEITVDTENLAPAYDERYIVGAEPQVPENPFTDVPEDSFYYESVLWAADNGITTGATETTFDPNGVCMRGHVVTFLWRAMGCPEPETTVNPFVDVKETDYFYNAVLWAYENGITTGIDATHFAPTGECNRAQVVTFLWRALDKPEVTSAESPFSDVTETDAFYYDAVLWAVAGGVTNGMGDGTFGVLTTCNRAQVVTFLYRALVTE